MRCGRSGANGGGGGRTGCSDAGEDDNSDVVMTGADDEMSFLKSLREDASILVVTMLRLISMIAAISWPGDGSPDSFVGTLLKLRDANLGIGKFCESLRERIAQISSILQ